MIFFFVARLDAMMLSDTRKDCILMGGTCIRHRAHPILQIFSVKLAKTPVVNCSVELYGYIAARDRLDPLLNYIVNIGRDDSINVEEVHFHTFLQLLQITFFVSQYKAKLITCIGQILLELTFCWYHADT